MKRLLVIFLLFPVSASFAKSLWSDRNMYSSGEILRVGDIVTVKIEDISQMRFSVVVNSNNTFSISSNPDANITGFLPKVYSDRKVQNTDKTDFSGKGNMIVSIAARVDEQLADGKFRISGTRQYSFNGVTSSFIVSGIIDPSLMKGRSILSDDIANFRLEVRGVREGIGIELTRPPLKEGETATPELTEEEKQRIIVDYLRKMLQELTR